MTPATSLIAYSAAAAVLTVTPGLDTALVLRTATIEGGRQAGGAGLGICAGTLIWGAATAYGVGVLLSTSAFAFEAIRWAGAAYLMYLGIGMLRSPRRAFAAGPVVNDDSSGRAAGRWFVRGLLTNLLNPKVGVFYVTFLPQFVPRETENAPGLMLAMAGIHAVEGMLWFGALIGATAVVGRWLRRPRVVRALDRVTGVLLVGFGAKLALTSR